MFGLFGKKKKEKAAPAEPETPEEETGGGESREFRALAADFEPEVLDALVLTGPNGFWGERKDGEELYTLGVELTAWLEEDVPGVHQGAFRLVTKGDEMLKEYLRSHVPGDFVLKVKVRLEKDGGDRLLMINLPEPGFDAELKEIRDEQCKPVTFWIDGLGTFTLARSVGWFEADVEWLGETIQLTIDQDVDRDGSVETAKALLEEAERWDRTVRDYAAGALLEEAAPTDEDGEPLTEEQFREQMVLESIQAGPEGAFEFWFNDGGELAGSSFHVSGTLESGPESAVLEV